MRQSCIRSGSLARGPLTSWAVIVLALPQGRRLLRSAPPPPNYLAANRQFSLRLPIYDQAAICKEENSGDSISDLPLKSRGFSFWFQLKPSAAVGNGNGHVL